MRKNYCKKRDCVNFVKQKKSNPKNFIRMTRSNHTIVFEENNSVRTVRIEWPLCERKNEQVFVGG